MEPVALANEECVFEDMNSEWTKDFFPKELDTKAGETVVFAFIVFYSREHRHEANAKVFKVPRVNGCGNQKPCHLI